MRSDLRHAGLVLLGLLLPCAQGWGEGLRLLTEESPPFNTMLVNGQVGGLSTTLLQTLFRRAGIPYTIELFPWSRAFGLARLEGQTCVYSTARTPAREHQFKWVGPLLQDPWVLYGGPFSPKGVVRLADARPYKVGDYNGDVEVQYLRDRGLDVDLSPTLESSMLKLAAGHIDFWATGIYVGHDLVQRDHLPQLKPVLTFHTSALYLACNPDVANATVKQLNAILAQMQREGVSNRVRKHYLVE
jgi:polar amino acid transport system substrate-binding protein